MKDETCGQTITEFVGLKPKMYSFICDGKEKKRAKGIKKSTVDRHITFQQYYDSVWNYARHKHSMNFIRSYLHEIYTVHVKKVSLTPYDNKRYILDDGINTLAYGNATIKELNENMKDFNNESEASNDETVDAMEC